ncbi:exodeoxyribonuclease VII large subunit [Candidatus Saccharibacteria bacterium]|nr:MAG: exodeoxyribonuclease VII large subunit [Candidatus Saccharibacteria bacterium]
MTAHRPTEDLVFSVSDFVAVLNQTLEFAYPYVAIEGELTNFRVSKNRWVFFDLKDETASLKCFATVRELPGPLEDGMVVRVEGSPRLHPLYNFSIQVQAIRPLGEGSLKRAADLLASKLEKEGLFDSSRKRQLSYPPRRVALITAGDSAAYADFIKVVGARWGGLRIDQYNVLVQGEQAPGEIIAALKTVNESDTPTDVVVLIRGGGSVEDLAVWSDERVVRAIAGSRVPTLVAIGHEIDVCLAELAADCRASTPSNAAELLVPDRKEELRHLRAYEQRLNEQLAQGIMRRRTGLVMLAERLDEELAEVSKHARQRLSAAQSLLAAYDPDRPLRQGYALVRAGTHLITRAAQLHPGLEIEVKLIDGTVTSQVKSITTKEK